MGKRFHRRSVRKVGSGKAGKEVTIEDLKIARMKKKQKKLAKKELRDSMKVFRGGLHPIDWGNSTEELPPFEKNFYKEHPKTAGRSLDEIEMYRAQNEITVKGDVPNPIIYIDEACFPDYCMDEIRRQNDREPTPIQAQSWPIAMSGLNMVGIAKADSGKIFAYLLPALVHIKAQPRMGKGDGPIALILVPTRELAQHIETVANKFRFSPGVGNVCLFGGCAKAKAIKDLGNFNQIVISTPLRFIDFLQDGETNLRRCTYLVLEETDRMLNMGFEPQLRKIIGQIRPDRQIVMWSGTWPRKMHQFAEDILGDCIQVNIGPLGHPENIQQNIIICQEHEKALKLTEILRRIYDEEQNPGKILIFVGTKRRVDQMARFISSTVEYCCTIHGGKSEVLRNRALQEFRQDKPNIMVATDVAAHCLDVEIKYVISFDFPQAMEEYVSRIERIGHNRAIAYTLFSKYDASNAQELVDMLRETNQNIHPRLLQFARGEGIDPERLKGGRGYGVINFDFGNVREMRIGPNAGDNGGDRETGGRGRNESSFGSGLGAGGGTGFGNARSNDGPRSESSQTFGTGRRSGFGGEGASEHSTKSGDDNQIGRGLNSGGGAGFGSSLSAGEGTSFGNTRINNGPKSETGREYDRSGLLTRSGPGFGNRGPHADGIRAGGGNGFGSDPYVGGGTVIIDGDRTDFGNRSAISSGRSESSEVGFESRCDFGSGRGASEGTSFGNARRRNDAIESSGERRTGCGDGIGNGGASGFMRGGGMEFGSGLNAGEGTGFGNGSGFNAGGGTGFGNRSGFGDDRSASIGSNLVNESDFGSDRSACGGGYGFDRGRGDDNRFNNSSLGNRSGYGLSCGPEFASGREASVGKSSVGGFNAFGSDGVGNREAGTNFNNFSSGFGTRAFDRTAGFDGFGNSGDCSGFGSGFNAGSNPNAGCGFGNSLGRNSGFGGLQAARGMGFGLKGGGGSLSSQGDRDGDEEFGRRNDRFNSRGEDGFGSGNNRFGGREDGFSRRSDRGFGSRDDDNSGHEESGFGGRGDRGIGIRDDIGFGDRGVDGFGTSGDDSFASRRDGGFDNRDDDGFGARGDSGIGIRNEGGFGGRGDAGLHNRHHGGFGRRLDGGSGNRGESGFDRGGNDFDNRGYNDVGFSGTNNAIFSRRGDENRGFSGGSNRGYSDGDRPNRGFDGGQKTNMDSQFNENPQGDSTYSRYSGMSRGGREYD